MIGAAILSMAASCADDESFSTSSADRLAFSCDTVSLDTTFSNVPTPTRSMWVYNRSGAGLRCSTVRLEGGNQYGFRVNVDGTYLGQETGYKTQDVEIRKGDSIRVFVELTSPMQNVEGPQKIEDNLVFALESGVQQKVNLMAYSWDAELLQGKTVQTGESAELGGTSKPIVLYGDIMVDSAATLTVKPGTTLYFHQGTGVDVYGTLVLAGEPGDEVMLRGDRIDHMFDYLPYDRTPGQWDGIHLYGTSVDSRISYTDIHSSNNGIVVDSNKVDRMALTLTHSTIHNCQGYGVKIDSAQVKIENTQISNALRNLLYVRGGNVTVNACTLAQFYPFDAGRGTALFFRQPLKNLKVTNSLVTGYGDDEVMWTAPVNVDSVKNPFKFFFDHCVLRTPQLETEDSLKFTNIVYEDLKVDSVKRGEAYVYLKDKHFVRFDTDNFVYDFRLKPTSAAVGVADTATLPALDRDGNERDASSADAGCFRHEPSAQGDGDDKEGDTPSGSKQRAAYLRGGRK